MPRSPRRLSAKGFTAADLRERINTAAEIIALWRGEREFILELATELTKDIVELEAGQAELERQHHNQVRKEAKAKRAKAARRQKKQGC